MNVHQRSTLPRAGYVLLGILLLVPYSHADTAVSIGVSDLPVSPTNVLPRQYAPGSSLRFANFPIATYTGSFQWLHDDQLIAGATDSSLTLTGLTAADNGNYRLRVTDGATVSYSNTAVVNVLPFPASPVDTSFTSTWPSSSYPSTVRNFAADGSIIAISVSGAYTARLAADGTLDAGFVLPSTAGAVIAGFSDGRMLTSRAPYLLAADGSALGFTLPAGFDSSKELSRAAVLADGSFYLAQGAYLARFLADGTLDPNFTFNVPAETAIGDLAVDRSGRLYVRGLRANPVPTNYPASWPVVYRMTATGALDPTFAVQTPSPLLTGSLQVVPLDDGRIFYRSTYHGYVSWHMLRDDGTIDPTWSGGVDSDNPVVVDPARNFVYVRPTSGALQRYLLTSTELVLDESFYPGRTVASAIGGITILSDGKLLLVTNLASWEGHTTQGLARLRTDMTRPTSPPNATISPGNATPSRGSTLTFTSTVTGAGPFTYQWLALDGQPLPSDTTSPQLVLTNFAATQIGRYQLRVTGLGGVSVLSNVTRAMLGTSALPYLANLSGRAVPGDGEDTVIAGFTTKVYAGALGVPLLIRGVGPGLKDLGVANYLPNPALNLTNLAGTVVANNDNWSASPDRDTIRTDFSSTGAFALADDSLDAALLKTSYNEQFTVQLSDQTNASGVGLLEIYRVTNDLVAGELTNLSFRARTGPGDAVAIAGFVIVDPQNFDRSARVLLRVVGPTLADLGVQHPLADPLLTLYNAKGEVVAHNDDWSLSPATNPTAAADVAAAMKQVGAFDLPANAKDAALLLDLPAGAYTLHATGGAGVVLLEIYLVR